MPDGPPKRAVTQRRRVRRRPAQQTRAETCAQDRGPETDMEAEAHGPLAVVTGASTGIGAATARALAERGHPLLLLARRAGLAEALDLPRALCRQVDVTDAVAVGAAIEEAEARYGPTDLLVNNAGQMFLGFVADQPTEQWKRMFDVNVHGLLNGVRSVLPGMIARGRGTLVNVSSVAGRNVYPNHTVYSGTKFAVEGMSESLRQEVAGHGVRVVTVAPGSVETEILSHTTHEGVKAGYQAFKDSIEVLAPEDVAAAVMYVYEQPQRVTVREIVLASTAQIT
ncbi:SDR family oxidoreductase [Streptomyces iconiensis]|uniref:SDR family oxidoreductase n=1 Tax=Streptomyces iconiensis TaxID=1384038 RepID=A0ABT7A0N8_9ACTN|nr:SDR family oxidoreductase [Streptomyces iconiensis]MDJ1134895.1 SDR family oxidoreductase [Streptomyces iconiensis]